MSLQPDLWDRHRTVRYGPMPRPCAAWVRLGQALEAPRVEPVELPLDVLLRVARELPLDEEEIDDDLAHDR
jgi:hypothetical protein